MKTSFHDILIASLLLAHCGGGGSIAGHSNQVIQNFDKETALESCNGSGTEFTGIYKVTTSKGSIVCDGESAQLPEIEFPIDCKQNDRAFNCLNDDGEGLNGCINKDGSFVVGAKLKETDMQTLKESIGDGITDIKAVGKIKAKVAQQPTHGNLLYDIVFKANQKNIGCTINWPLTFSHQ